MATVVLPITSDTTFEEWKDVTNELIDAMTNGANEIDVATATEAGETAVAMAVALS